MSVKFKVSGPFPIPYRSAPRGGGKIFDKEHIAIFWDGEASEFAEKQGCYIFGLSVGGSYMPYYVGRTRNSMMGECFNPTNILKYNSVVFENKGKPVMFFVTRRDNRKVVPRQILNDLERTLIQAGKLRNDWLVNQKHTQNLPTWTIAGVVRSGPGEDGKASRLFRKMMNM